MLTAIFFPANPEALAYDLEAQARAAMGDGMKLYTDGSRFALLRRPIKGWALFGGRHV